MRAQPACTGSNPATAKEKGAQAPNQKPRPEPYAHQNLLPRHTNNPHADLKLTEHCVSNAHCAPLLVWGLFSETCAILQILQQHHMSDEIAGRVSSARKDRRWRPNCGVRFRLATAGPQNPGTARNSQSKLHTHTHGRCICHTFHQRLDGWLLTADAEPTHSHASKGMERVCYTCHMTDGNTVCAAVVDDDNLRPRLRLCDNIR